MTGIIDVGGGMRGAYTAGMYDYLLDHHIFPGYCLGVSAGSANMASYLAGQRGRNRRFYMQYAARKEYMSFSNLMKTGSYIDLDYVYDALSGTGGEDPLDYEAFAANPVPFVVVATDALTGQPRYFTRADLPRDHYDPIKASCCLPMACKPYLVNGRPYFDGGVSDPVPYQKALDDGCTRILVLLTRPRDFVRPPLKHEKAMAALLRAYPKAWQALQHRHEVYNRQVAQVKELERQGRALLLAPLDIEGMSTLRHNEFAMGRLYGYGYQDGAKAAAFLTE